MQYKLTEEQFLALKQSSLEQILAELGCQANRSYNVIVSVEEIVKPGTGKTVCLDFDGVLHQYSSGWQGPGVIADPPVKGAVEFVRSLLDQDFTVAVYSSRSRHKSGRRNMRQWMLEHGFPVDLISFPEEKPPAILYIDDRGYTFDGKFPSTDFILNFKPWNKK